MNYAYTTDPPYFIRLEEDPHELEGIAAGYRTMTLEAHTYMETVDGRMFKNDSDAAISFRVSASEVFKSDKPKKRSEIPPPCWDERPISGERCVAATRAMCG